MSRSKLPVVYGMLHCNVSICSVDHRIRISSEFEHKGKLGEKRLGHKLILILLGGYPGPSGLAEQQRTCLRIARPGGSKTCSATARLEKATIGGKGRVG